MSFFKQVWPGMGSLARLCAYVFLSIVPGFLFCGCSSLNSSQSQETASVKALNQKNEKVGSTTMSALQSEVMRFADDYAARVAQATDDFSQSSTNAENRVIALRWKLEQAGAAYVNAANRNPILNALDMIVLATISRMVVESQSAEGKFTVPAAALLDTHRRLETNSWNLVNNVLRDDQKAEFQEMLQEWRKNNPNQRYVGGIRFREFALSLASAPEKTKSKPTSIFNLLFIDPMAGLDPTARAIEETRQSAERFTYYAQRAPLLLSWQVELLGYQLAAQPAARQMLTDAQRLSKSAEVFGQTAERMPQVIDQQREAAIKQLLEGVATERTNLLASLSAEEGKVRGLLTETRETLQAGDQMAGSVTLAIQALDSFVRSVSPDSNAAPSVVNTNKRPFNIVDYGDTARQIGAMANEINALLTSATQSMPHAAGLGQQAMADARGLMDHAFYLGVVLIVLLLLALVFAGLAYRMVSRKLGLGAPRAAQETKPESHSYSG